MRKLFPLVVLSLAGYFGFNHRTEILPMLHQAFQQFVSTHLPARLQNPLAENTMLGLGGLLALAYTVGMLRSSISDTAQGFKTVAEPFRLGGKVLAGGGKGLGWIFGKGVSLVKMLDRRESKLTFGEAMAKLDKTRQLRNKLRIAASNSQGDLNELRKEVQNSTSYYTRAKDVLESAQTSLHDKLLEATATDRALVEADKELIRLEALATHLGTKAVATA